MGYPSHYAGLLDSPAPPFSVCLVCSNLSEHRSSLAQPQSVSGLPPLFYPSSVQGAMQLTCAGDHSFCSACLSHDEQGLVQCTECSAKMKPEYVAENFGLNSVIRKLEIKCAREAEGCSWRGVLAELGSHEVSMALRRRTPRRAGGDCPGELDTNNSIY